MTSRLGIEERERQRERERGGGRWSGGGKGRVVSKGACILK